MKGLRNIPRILKINAIDGYNVSLLFNNGESRKVDFINLFKVIFKITEKHPAFKLVQNKASFDKITITGNSIGWQEIGVFSLDEHGENTFYPYELDPLVLYKNSIPDKERDIIIGNMVKEARLEAGITQEELARKSGTSKHYISRLENNKSDIELMTLKKIIEAGLGKKLFIGIE